MIAIKGRRGGKVEGQRRGCRMQGEDKKRAMGRGSECGCVCSRECNYQTICPINMMTQPILNILSHSPCPLCRVNIAFLSRETCSSQNFGLDAPRGKQSFPQIFEILAFKTRPFQALSTSME